tara:strand:- start:556 stop:1389 length:834 start_codon:yes stop_codon:yes gene_type:complete
MASYAKNAQEFAPFRERNIPYVVNFSTTRTASTKLINIFDSAAKVLDINIYCYKSHPSYYQSEKLNYSMINNNMIIVLSYRELLPQISSFIRTAALQKRQIFSEKIFIYAINYIISELKKEKLILNQALRNKCSLYITSYDYLTNNSPEILIQDAAKILAKLSGINSYESKVRNFINNSSLFNGLVRDKGLTKQAAREIQKQYGTYDSSIYDKRTFIHGEHIADENSQWFSEFLSSNITIDHLEYINLINKKNMSKLLRLVRSKRDAKEISYLKHLY